MRQRAVSQVVFQGVDNSPDQAAVFGQPFGTSVFDPHSRPIRFQSRKQRLGMFRGVSRFPPRGIGNGFGNVCPIFDVRRRRVPIGGLFTKLLFRGGQVSGEAKGNDGGEILRQNRNPIQEGGRVIQSRWRGQDAFPLPRPNGFANLQSGFIPDRDCFSVQADFLPPLMTGLDLRPKQLDERLSASPLPFQNDPGGTCGGSAARRFPSSRGKRDSLLRLVLPTW